MKGFTRVLVYALVAAVATVVNLGCQALVMWLYHGSAAVQLSIAVGTAAGLPVRYVLEKHYVFQFRADNLAHDGSLFMLYSAMGVGTTLLFWGIEYGFHLLFRVDGLRYLGGALGLTLGYIIKYQLDRRYVFVRRT